MASLHFLLIFSFVHFLDHVQAQVSFLPDNFILLPVTKDLTTLQYTAQVHHAISPVPTELVIDLGGPFSWLGSATSDCRVIPSCSIQCSMVNTFRVDHKSCFSSTTCDLRTRNGITQSVTRGQLAEDIVAVRSRSGEFKKIGNFLFVCAPFILLHGLASGAKGILGLGRTPVALPSQVAAKFDFHQKFATCFPSSDGNGVLLFGNLDSNSIFGPEISGSLMYTPLITNPSGESHEYFINVKFIKINGKRLALGQEGIARGTKISTTVPYTTLDSSIYGTFLKAYMEAATSINMTRVDPVSPFGVCFDSKGIRSTGLGPMVPEIDLVLQSEMVRWRIHGRNSMVEVTDEMTCLGLLDGGASDSKPSIVIGGLQLEDTLLEFDVGTSMLGFSLPLWTRHKSCSNYMLESRVKNSL